jgi:hypothetical protein
LRAGFHDAALHALTDDNALPFKSPDQIAMQYKDWQAGRLSGFTRIGASS